MSGVIHPYSSRHPIADVYQRFGDFETESLQEFRS